MTYLSYQSSNQSSAPGWGSWSSWKEKRGYPPQFGPPQGPPHGFPGWGPPHGPPNHPQIQQLYYISGNGPNGACQAITTSGQVVDVNCDIPLPALCTQSAQLSGINTTDTSARFQTSVTSGAATYTGYRDLVSFRFLGIQYGTHPQRFTYSSVYNNSGAVDALQFGAICRQIDAITNVNDGSEDCLHINIYTPYLPNPNDKSPKLKPVMFW